MSVVKYKIKNEKEYKEINQKYYDYGFRGDCRGPRTPREYPFILIVEEIYYPTEKEWAYYTYIYKSDFE